MAIVDSAIFATVPLEPLQSGADVARKTGFVALCPRQLSHRTNAIQSTKNGPVYDLDQ